MSTILDKIVANRAKQVAQLKATTSVSTLKEQIAATSKARSLRTALSAAGLSVIAECKKASPSKGVICADFDYLRIAKEYEQAGAAAISVLTEQSYFQGDNRYLTEISAQVNIPVLRKDFIIDPIQIYEARAIGADAILLICEILTDEQLAQYLSLARLLGMDCLVEARDKAQITRALAAGADIIGVNNRNLNDFSVDLQTSVNLRGLVPKECIFVSESGIHTRADAELLEQAGAQAILVGEGLVASGDITGKLRELTGALA